MLARGFPLSLLNRVHAGLATSHLAREGRGNKAIEIVRVKITEGGRKACLSSPLGLIFLVLSFRS
jgi:hypothetical protein